MNIEIRPATNADTDDIVRIIKLVHDEYGFTWEADGYHADLYDIEKEYIGNGGMFWLMLADGGPICTCGIENHGGATCELGRLYMLPDYRGKALGQRMLEHSIEWSREHGYTKMLIWSDVKLTQAHVLYERRGARFVGQRLCDDPDNSTENGYELDLA